MRATGVADLWGVRFRIEVPENLLSFDALQVGPFLTENGTVAVTNNNLEILRPLDAGGVSGSGQIALVAWVYEGPIGNGVVELEGEALDADGDVIPGVDFNGGTVTITN